MAPTYRAALRTLMERYEQSDIWSRYYIRKQMAAALRLWRKGERPSNNCPDLVCTLWCELPKVKPYWQITYTQPMGWNGQLETPRVWTEEHRYPTREQAHNMAYFAVSNERFGCMKANVDPVFRGTWCAYNAPVVSCDAGAFRGI